MGDGSAVDDGDILEIYVDDPTLPAPLNKRFTQVRVVSAVDVDGTHRELRVSRPFGFAIKPSIVEYCTYGSANLAVTGTLDAPQVFQIGPSNGFRWD